MSDAGARAPSPDGGALWYRVSGDGPAVVLIAGLGGDHTAWDDALPSLAGHTVVVLDNRGVGESSDPPRADWSTRDSARDVVAVLDAAGLSRASVYGHSLGGRIAQWVAADHPNRVDRLVLGATTAGGPEAIPRPERATRAFAADDPAAVLDLVYPPDYLRSHPEAVDRLANHSRTPELAAAQLAMSTAHDASAALGRITAPTLIVHGTEDGVTDVGNAEVLRRGIPHADLLLIGGARHGYADSHPAANAMVAAFLAG